MSGAVIPPKVRTRRLIVRAALCVVYVCLVGLVFALGKGHTIILDNKDAEDGSVKAIESLSISVDGQEPIDLQAGDRDMAKVRGQGHKVEVTVMDGQKVENRIRVPLGEELVLLSIPKLMAGVKPAVVPFVPKEDATPPDQGTNSNAFTSPDANAPAQPGGAPAQPGAPAAPAKPSNQPAP
ncbi:MAG: DUF6672 family protein [Holophaga sp.]